MMMCGVWCLYGCGGIIRMPQLTPQQYMNSACGAVAAVEVLLQEAQRSMQIADTLLQLNDRLQHLTRAEDVPQAADTQNTAAAAAAAPAAGQRGGRAQRRSTRAASKNAAAAAAAAAAAPTLPSNEAAGSSPTASSAVLSYEVALKGLVVSH
jgi:TolA-binding protein